MNTKVNKVPTPERATNIAGNKPDAASTEPRPNGAIPNQAQRGVSQDDDILDELMVVWQQHSERLEQIARHHDLSQIRLAPRALVFSSRRRSAFASMAVAIASLAVIAGMVILRRQFVSDTFDLLFFLFLVLMLVLVSFRNLRQLRLLRHPVNFRPSTFGLQLSRAAVFASVVVLLLFTALPVQNGRSMSHATLSQRSAAMANVSYVLSQI